MACCWSRDPAVRAIVLDPITPGRLARGGDDHRRQPLG
jgi:hypothetical protein